jgi:hypothetical protein
MVDERNGWTFHSMAYRRHVGDAEWLMKEALRRAVDIRDGRTNAGTELVDVLNLLKDAMGFPPEASGAAWLWSDAE